MQETNLGVAPYFDDFSEDKNYQKILFKPATPIQARELNQQQTIFQSQIEKFGKHVFKEGSIVEGCSIIFDNKYNYVKINDNYSNGSSFNLSNFVGNFIKNQNNLKAYVENYAAGSIAESPDLNTLYVKYVNSAEYANGYPQKTFDSGDLLTSYTSSNVEIGTFNVANSSFSPIGLGYSIRISDGVIFQKGFFINVLPQTIIVQKYNNSPNNISVGFTTNEEIISYYKDSTLLDNAAGAPNYAAPGADRLKMTANLVSRETSNTSTENFFSLVDFRDGSPIYLRTDPQYNILGDQLAKRTYEESGDYVVIPFPVTSESISGNTSHFKLYVERGTGYIKGYRVEQIGRRGIILPKGTDKVFVDDQITTINYGNYLICDEVSGLFDVGNNSIVYLYDSPGNSITNDTFRLDTVPAANGSLIGNANIRTITYQSGIPGTSNAQYRFYLTNINLASGKNFKDIRSLYSNNLIMYGKADPVLESNNAILKETTLSSLVFDLGQKAIDNLSNTKFIFRTTEDIQFNTSGSVTFSPDATQPGGTDTFYYQGTLSESNKDKFRFIALSNGQYQNATGTVVVTNGQTNVVGTSTTFTTYYNIGDYIAVGNAASQFKQISSITNNTLLTVGSAFSANIVGASHRKFIPLGSTISFKSSNASIVTSGNTCTANIDSGITLEAAFNAQVEFDVLRTDAEPVQKSVNKNRFIKIFPNSNDGGLAGPWCLGLSDVYKLRSVYLNYGSYANTNNQVNNFYLDSNQRDAFYGLSYLYIQPGSAVSINSSARLLVEVDHFSHSFGTGIGFLSKDSYVIDDANTSNTTAITTQEIPIFTSPFTGQIYDLRNCVDFRPIITNTANSATVANNATENPSTTSVFNLSADGLYTVTPDSNFQTDYEFYVGRKVKATLSKAGSLEIVSGPSGINPTNPKDIEGNMTIAIVNIPPYPSLSQQDAITYKRQDYGIDITPIANKRYTMRDIGVLADRIERLEYYTTLSLLEKATKDFYIADSNGLDRFKNGFLVDPFKDYAVSDLQDPEYKAAIDREKTILRPKIKRNYIDLVLNTANNTAQYGNLTTLSYSSNTYIEQPFATKTRACVEGSSYFWRGNITLDPQGDILPDYDINAKVIYNDDRNVNQIILSPNNSYSAVWGDWLIRYEIRQESDNSAETFAIYNKNTGKYINHFYSEISAENELSRLESFRQTSDLQSYQYGSGTIDNSIQPYLRPRNVKFIARNMKPNTIVFPFFDDLSISSYCTPANSSLIAIGSEGDSLTSDSTGTVYGLFRIPQGIFTNTNKKMKLIDNSNSTSTDITTIATGTYFGNILNEDNYTRPPEIAQRTLFDIYVIPANQFSEGETHSSADPGGDSL